MYNVTHKCTYNVALTYTYNVIVVDGGWGVWSTWSQCSSTCTGGEKERIKTCTNPFPLFGGKNCVGAELDRAPCNTDIACPGMI